LQQVVVVAEDGVTTRRYPIQFLLVQGAEQYLTVAEAEGGSTANDAYAPSSPGGRRSGE